MNADVLDMIAKVVAVNVVATLILAVLSYFGSALMLEGLASLDRPAGFHTQARERFSEQPGSAESTCVHINI